MKHLFIILLVSLFSACTVCTEIGCVDGIVIELTPESQDSVKVIAVNRSGFTESLNCVGSECPTPIIMEMTDAEWVSVQVKRDSITIQDDTFPVIYSEFRPNGENCDPVCTQATIDIE